jgi:hypothetical protein
MLSLTLVQTASGKYKREYNLLNLKKNLKMAISSNLNSESNFGLISLNKSGFRGWKWGRGPGGMTASLFKLVKSGQFILS